MSPLGFQNVHYIKLLRFAQNSIDAEQNNIDALRWTGRQENKASNPQHYKVICANCLTSFQTNTALSDPEHQPQ